MTTPIFRDNFDIYNYIPIDFLVFYSRKFHNAIKIYDQCIYDHNDYNKHLYAEIEAQNSKYKYIQIDVLFGGKCNILCMRNYD